MKGSPLNALGDKTTGTVKVEGVTKRITYQDPPSSARTNTIGTVQGPTTPRGFTIPTIADTTPVETKPKAKTTTPSSAPRQKKVTENKKTSPKKTNKKTPVSSEPLTTRSFTSNANKTSNAKTTSEAGVKAAKFLNSGKQTTKTEEAKSTKSTEVSKSRKEVRLAKTKNKAAKVKSDYNAGSRGQMEGKAARAKHNRLNKRATRIEKRISKKK